MKENFCYPISTNETGEGIEITFIDFPDLVTCAQSREDVVKMAQEVLAMRIIDLEKRNQPIPEPTQAETGVTYIHVWMPFFRNSSKEIYVKKSVTIPQWLDILAKDNSINFSATLVKGLKSELGMKD